MLAYRLDTDIAFVPVSVIAEVAPGSASAEGACKFAATIEDMQKVNSDQKDSLTQSLVDEWESVFVGGLAGAEAVEAVSSKVSAYWDQPASKLRRLESEPASPNKT